MDELDTLDYEHGQLLCSGEQLPSGLFQSVVRRRSAAGDIRPLMFDSEMHGSAGQALEHAKELAKKWMREQDIERDGNA